MIDHNLNIDLEYSDNLSKFWYLNDKLISFTIMIANFLAFDPNKVSHWGDSNRPDDIYIHPSKVFKVVLNSQNLPSSFRHFLLALLHLHLILSFIFHIFNERLFSLLKKVKNMTKNWYEDFQNNNEKVWRYM